MTKNVSVIDENGIVTGSTYPKRALGLVKKGRARWIDADTICLCAPKKEEKQMNLYEVFDNQISKMQEQIKDEDPETAMPVRLQILKTIETFKAQEQGDKVIDMVREQLVTMQEQIKDDDLFTPENVQSREVTRQKMLDLMGSFCNNQRPEE